MVRMNTLADALKSINNAEKKGKRQVSVAICRHSNKEIYLFHSKYCNCNQTLIYYASPSSVETYSARQLTTNFDRVDANMFPYKYGLQNRVCSYPKKRKPLWLRQYQSYISN